MLMMILALIIAVAIIYLASLFEAWLIACLAGLMGIEIGFKLIFFVVFVINLFFGGGFRSKN